MSTSGSSNFNLSRNEIILDAFQLLGVYGIGRTVSAEDMSLAVRYLNKMVKAWGARGLHLFTKEEGVLFITPNQAGYKLGNSPSDAYATLASDLVMTQLNGSLTTSATNVTVSDTAGMTIGDFIGIVQADKSIHWTTIAAIPTNTTLTLTLGIVSPANDSAYVYTFTNRIYKPLRVLNARRATGIDLGSTSTLFETPMTSIAYQEYFDLPVKTSPGVPNQFHYNPKRITGNMYLWPRPSDGSERIHFTFERVIEDLDTINDDFDFPSEWLECLTWQLAVRLGPAFGKGQKVMNEIVPIASQLYEDLLSWDSEITSCTIEPNNGY